MRRKLLGFAAGAAVAFAGYYLMLFLVLGIWGLTVDQWAVVAMVTVPTGLAVATTAWVIRRQVAVIGPALASGLVAGAAIALVAELFVDGLDIAVLGVAITLAAEAFVLDTPTEEQSRAETAAA